MIIRLYSIVICFSILVTCLQAQDVQPLERHEDLQQPPTFMLDKDAPPSSTDTVIEADDEVSFNAKDKVAVFIGNVRVRNPQFNLDCKKLTVEMNTEEGGLKKAIAEGDVIIVQDKGENGTRSTGRAKQAVYEADSGDITLTGSPEVMQGINVHKSTDPGTRMVLNRDGRLKTYGQSITLIQDKVDAGEKKR